MSSKSLFLSLNPCRMHFVRTQESHCYNGVMPLTRFKCNCFKPFVIVELSNFHCLVNPSLTSIFAHIRGGESSWHAMAFSWCNRFLSNIFALHCNNVIWNSADIEIGNEQLNVSFLIRGFFVVVDSCVCRLL